MATCEYCDSYYNKETGDGCPGCAAYMKEQQAYYSALFAGQHRYTREDIEDCYSEPCEYNKRVITLERLGL